MKKEYTAPLAELIDLTLESFLSASGESLGEVISEDGFSDSYGRKFR